MLLPSRAGAPPLMLAAMEPWRAAAELASLPWALPLLARAPRGDGHPVLVLPGFAAGDRSTLPLRRYLRGIGYDARRWALGRNFDHHAAGADGARLAARLRAIHDETRRKVSLVGWSLGGMLAREAARRDPAAVRQVVTLGSPFRGDPRASNLWRVFAWTTGQDVGSPAFARRIAAAAPPPPVPATAIFSRTDGIVAWRGCMEQDAPHTDNIAVRGSHCGLVANPAVLYAVADRLAQAEDAWAPFARGGWRDLFYPAVARPD